MKTSLAGECSWVAAGGVNRGNQDARGHHSRCRFMLALRGLLCVCVCAATAVGGRP